MQFHIGSVQKNDAPCAEQARIKARESRAKSLPGTIRLAQKLRRLGIPQQRCGLVDDWQNLVSQKYVAYRGARNTVAGSRKLTQQAVWARYRDVIHFGEIVICRGQPEHRNRIDPRGRGFFRQFDRGQSFIDGKHRATQQADLLSGHNCGRTLA